MEEKKLKNIQKKKEKKRKQNSTNMNGQKQGVTDSKGQKKMDGADRKIQKWILMDS